MIRFFEFGSFPSVKKLNAGVSLETALCHSDPFFRERPQIAPRGSTPDEEKPGVPFKVSGTHPDHRFYDHVSQQVHPEAPPPFLGKRSPARVTGKDVLKK